MLEYSTENIRVWTRMGMRKSFGPMMERIIGGNRKAVILAADVASSANLQYFAEKFPGQFYNIGIAEQNMAGIAAGLAKEGNNVFIVSFASFVSMRAFEAVRTLLGYMHLNVKVIALASGFSLGTQGNTHYCFEDLALMRTIPGMLVLSPADCVEEAKCLEYLAEYEGPAYLRLTGIDGSTSVFKEDYSYPIGKAIPLKEGGDVCIFSTGSITAECVRVSRALKRDGISCSVMDVQMIKPLDRSVLENSARTHKLLVTVEEHSVLGGLGGAIAEYLAGFERHPPLLRLGIPDCFPHAGVYSYMQQQCGLAADEIRKSILEKYHLLEKKEKEHDKSGEI